MIIPPFTNLGKKKFKVAKVGLDEFKSILRYEIDSGDFGDWLNMSGMNPL
mgnify:CR=1 FL=1